MRCRGGKAELHKVKEQFQLGDPIDPSMIDKALDRRVTTACS